MRFFRYVVHKLVPIKMPVSDKSGITQQNIDGIGSKVNQFNCTLVQTCILNIRILAYAIL